MHENEELIGVLTAISVISKQMARDLIRLQATGRKESYEKYRKRRRAAADRSSY